MTSETEAIRRYCEKHKNDIFDVGFLHKTLFKHLSEATFRKFVSRLAEEKILYPVGKGIYTIGVVNDLDKLVIKHYTHCLSGMPAGDFLFYEKGYLLNKPSSFDIFSNHICGGKTIGNVKVNELEINSFNEEVQFCILFLEGLKAKKDGFAEWIISIGTDKIEKALRNLSDYEMEQIIMNTRYSRLAYIQLAKLFQACNISNNIERYIDKKWNLLSEKVK